MKKTLLLIMACMMAIVAEAQKREMRGAWIQCVNGQAMINNNVFFISLIKQIQFMFSGFFERQEFFLRLLVVFTHLLVFLRQLLFHMLTVVQ